MDNLNRERVYSACGTRKAYGILNAIHRLLAAAVEESTGEVEGKAQRLRALPTQTTASNAATQAHSPSYRIIQERIQIIRSSFAPHRPVGAVAQSLPAFLECEQVMDRFYTVLYDHSI